MKSRYKFKWCTLFGYSPDLHCVPIVFQPPAVPLQSAADWQPILSHISDVSFVLTQCCDTQFTDRKVLTSVLKFGLGLCNAFLKARGFYAPADTAEGDVMVTCVSSRYTYTAEQVAADMSLQEVVRRKYTLCMKLQRLRLYNAVLVAGNRSLSDYNCLEFEHYCRRSVFDLCIE